MRIKLTVTTIWKVDPHDEEMARELLENQPCDAMLDYLDDAAHGDQEFTTPDAKAELLED